MKRMLPALLLTPLLLACPGSMEGGGGTSPNPPDNSLGFKWDRGNTTVAGSYGLLWQIEYTPTSTDHGVKWHLDGAGALLDGSRNAVDLTSYNQFAFGYYVPPATVPPGGITVYLSIEAWNPITLKWETSPRYPIQVNQQTSPMQYSVAFGSPTNASLRAGGSAGFTVEVNPRPLNLQQQASILPGPGSPNDVGSVSWKGINDTQWGIIYQAPATVVSPFDVTVQAVAHDPWFNQDRTLSFPVHVDP